MQQPLWRWFNHLVAINVQLCLLFMPSQAGMWHLHLVGEEKRTNWSAWENFGDSTPALCILADKPSIDDVMNVLPTIERLMKIMYELWKQCQLWKTDIVHSERQIHRKYTTNKRCSSTAFVKGRIHCKSYMATIYHESFTLAVVGIPKVHSGKYSGWLCQRLVKHAVQKKRGIHQGMMMIVQKSDLACTTLCKCGGCDWCIILHVECYVSLTSTRWYTKYLRIVFSSYLQVITELFKYN